MTAEASVEGRDRLHSEILRIWSRLLETADLSIDDDDARALAAFISATPLAAFIATPLTSRLTPLAGSPARAPSLASRLPIL